MPLSSISQLTARLEVPALCGMGRIINEVAPPMSDRRGIFWEL